MLARDDEQCNDRVHGDRRDAQMPVGAAEFQTQGIGHETLLERPPHERLDAPSNRSANSLDRFDDRLVPVVVQLSVWTVRAQGGWSDAPPAPTGA